MAIERWQRVRMGDIAAIKHGWPFKSRHFAEQLTGRPVVVAIGNFEYTGGFRFASTTVKEYHGEYPRQYELSPGDIVMVMTCQTPGGEILGIPARVPNDGRTYLHNQRIGKVVITRPDRISADFLYWVFLWKEFNQELVASASGTKIVHTAPSRIEAFEFDLPSMDEQTTIAKLLWAIEDKIELNRRMNRALEATAAALFKSWFVDFDPVTAKAEGRRVPGVPEELYEALPARFVSGEERPIPEGWTEVPLDRAVDILSGGTPATKEPAYWNGQIPWFSVVDSPRDNVFVLRTQRTITPLGIEHSAARLLPAGVTIVTARGTVGEVAIAGVPMCINQSCFALRSRLEGVVAHTYFMTKFLVSNLQRFAHGSVFDTITRATFSAIDVVGAPPAYVHAFEATVKPLLTRIRCNVAENIALASLRDALLPQLLTGALRPHAVEQSFAAVT